MSFKDDELTLEELMEVTAGIKEGKTDEMLDKLSKPELIQLGNAINPERELTIEELENVKAGIPKEMVEEMIEENPNLFRR